MDFSLLPLISYILATFYFVYSSSWVTCNIPSYNFQVLTQLFKVVYIITACLPIRIAVLLLGMLLHM